VTILPEVEQRLVDAAEHRFADRRSVATRRPRFLRSTKLLLAGCASLAVAVPAVAATRPWEPLLGKPSVDGRSPRTTQEAIPAQQRALLGVLRRAQTETDRSAATLGLLEPLAPTTDGVRLQGIRLLGGSAGAPAVALVPVARLYKRLPDQGGQLLAQDALCLTDHSSVVCATTEQLRAGGLMGSAGNYSYGLVPDGVASVRFTLPDGQTQTVAVVENFFEAELQAIPEHPTGAQITLFQQRDPDSDPPRDRPTATITWLDSDGRAVPR